MYKIQLLVDTDITFVLAAGGHNAGIVSEPGHPHRSYQIATHEEGTRHYDPDTWQAITPKQEGSWWPAWQAWLEGYSSGPEAAPPMGAPDCGYPPLADAPGVYVLQE